MIKKWKCKKCGHKVMPDKGMAYTVKESLPIIEVLKKSPQIFEAYDCPACGHQNLIGIRLEKYCEKDVEE